MNIPTNAKCPKCDKLLTTVTAGHTEITIPSETRRYHALTYACSSCQTLLGIQMDPLALKNDLIDGLFERLRKGAA